MGVGRMSTRWNLKYEHFADAVAGLLPGASVLEVGCGGGQFTVVASERHPQFTYHGCDLSYAALAQAERSGTVSYLGANAMHLPYKSDTFDLVIGLDIFEHLSDLDQALREVARVLTPEGRFFVFMPCEDTPGSLMRLIRRLPPTRDLTRRHWGHVQYVTPWEFITAVETAGLSVSHVRYAEHVVAQALHLLSVYLPKEMLMRVSPESLKAVSDNAPGLQGAHDPGEAKASSVVARVRRCVLRWAKKAWTVAISSPVACYTYYEDRTLATVPQTACGVYLHAERIRP